MTQQQPLQMMPEAPAPAPVAAFNFSSPAAAAPSLLAPMAAPMAPSLLSAGDWDGSPQPGTHQGLSVRCAARHCQSRGPITLVCSGPITLVCSGMGGGIFGSPRCALLAVNVWCLYAASSHHPFSSSGLRLMHCDDPPGVQHPLQMMPEAPRSHDFDWVGSQHIKEAGQFARGLRGGGAACLAVCCSPLGEPLTLLVIGVFRAGWDGPSRHRHYRPDPGPGESDDPVPIERSRRLHVSADSWEIAGILGPGPAALHPAGGGAGGGPGQSPAGGDHEVHQCDGCAASGPSCRTCPSRLVPTRPPRTCKVSTTCAPPRPTPLTAKPSGFLAGAAICGGARISFRGGARVCRVRVRHRGCEAPILRWVGTCVRGGDANGDNSSLCLRRGRDLPS